MRTVCVSDSSENPFVRNEEKIATNSATRRETPLSFIKYVFALYRNFALTDRFQRV